MQNEWVPRFEEMLMPSFRRIADEIARDFPRVRISIRSHPVGSRTEYQGHDLGVECLFPDAPPDVCDNVALSIGLWHLTSRPQLNTADVCWGDPGGLETVLIRDPIDLSEAVLEKVEAMIPTLEAALKAAVARGRPDR